MKSIITSFMLFLGRALLTAATDKPLREAIYRAVHIAETSNLKGEAKMKRALYEIKMSHTKSLINETESSLRTKIEQTLDYLDDKF